MLDFNHSFLDIQSFIDHLKSKKEVIGIVEYGGRSYTDMTHGGDYDLTVILDEPLSENLNGVHFHIAGIPVDCMILSKDLFLHDTPITDFLLAHLNCTILFDRNNVTSDLLKKIKDSWGTPKEISEFEKHFFRFVGRHSLDKLEHRLLDDPIYSKYIIFSSFDFYLNCYARINNLEIGKSKLYLSHIKDKLPTLYHLIGEMYSSSDLIRQYEILKEVTVQIFEPIGSIWKDNELLLHLLPKGAYLETDEENVIDLLFSK